MDWQKFKKWYVGFAFVGLAFAAIFRIVDNFGFNWGEIMERVFWAYFDVAFLLAFILLGIFIFWPRKTKEEKTTVIEKQPVNTAGNKQVSINVNIDSGDFTNANMDTERMDKFFGSIVNISGESGSYNKTQSSAEIKPKERTD